MASLITASQTLIENLKKSGHYFIVLYALF